MLLQSCDWTEECYEKRNTQTLNAVSRWIKKDDKSIILEEPVLPSYEAFDDDRHQLLLSITRTSVNILIVDDHDCIHDSIYWLLKQYRHFKLYHADTIDEMWQQLHQQEIDVVLLDIHLPDGNGLREVPKIRRLRPEVKIVPLTIENDPDYVAVEGTIGVDGWIPKGSAFPRLFHQVLFRVLEDTTGPSSCRLILPTHTPNIDVLFCSDTKPFSEKERGYLGQIINTMKYLPNKEARYSAAQSLGISETSLKDYHTGTSLLPFTTIQKAISATISAAVQWMDTALSLDQVAEMVSQYSARGLNRLVQSVFGISLSQIRKVIDIRLIATNFPIPISFILSSSIGTEIQNIIIRANVRT